MNFSFDCCVIQSSLENLHDYISDDDNDRLSAFHEFHSVTAVNPRLRSKVISINRHDVIPE